MELTEQDLMNILVLINKAPISGADAEPVALLKHKVKALAETLNSSKEAQ